MRLQQQKKELEAKASILIAAGFALTIVLMAGLIVISLSRLNTIHRTVDELVNTEHAALESLYSMQVAARERTLLLHMIMDATDNIDREEKIDQFYALSSVFATARQKMLALDLHDDERKLLEKQRLLTNATVPWQHQVIELARQGKTSRAHRVFMEKAIPAQNLVLATLRELLDHEIAESAGLAAITNHQRRDAHLFIIAIGIGAIFMSMLIAFLVNYRLSRLFLQLTTTSEQLQTTLRYLEYQKLALDQHAIVSMTDASGTITYANDKFTEISGYSREELVGQNHRMLRSGEHPPSFYADMWDSISHGKVWHGVVCNRTKHGSHYWVNTTIVPFLDTNDLPYQYVSIRTDITAIMEAEAVLSRSKEHLEEIVRMRMEDLVTTNQKLQHEIEIRVRLEEDLHKMASQDSLTGIFNRRKFDEMLIAEIGRTARYQSPLSLIIFDVDHFKRINDLFGHQAGDTVLSSLVQLVSSKIRSVDVFARWGGEEFIIYIPNSNLAACRNTADKLCAEIAQHDFPDVGRITCSFGITEICQGDTAEVFIRRADDALYKAKKNGRNRVEWECLAPISNGSGCRRA